MSNEPTASDATNDTENTENTDNTDKHGHAMNYGSGGSHDHAHGHAHNHGDGDPTAWIPDAVLDAQISIPPVLGRFLAEVEDMQPSHIIDLGCGPGVGTLELAAQFPEASISGLDINQSALDAATERAEQEGVADRTNFVQADFDADFSTAVASADLLWASMSLHHTIDPAAALAHACKTLAPGGRIALAEFGPQVNMWPETADIVTSGAWERFQAAMAEGLADHLGPASTNVQWLDLLATEGMEQVRSIECPIRFAAPLSGRERDWLTTHLSRGLQFTADRAPQEDIAALEAVLDRDNPNGVSRSNTIFVDYGRTVFTGVRP